MAYFIFLFFVSVLGYGQCAFVDTLNKCSIADKECQRDLIQNVLKTIGETGVPDIGMPPIDPIELKELNASIPNVLDIIIADATAKGVKDCVIDSYDISIENLLAKIQLTCDIIIKGKYNVKTSTPLIKNLFGGDIHGEGVGKVKVEKITLNIEFPFEIEKRGDDTFLTSKPKTYKYTYNINGKVIFQANNLILAGKESSKDIVQLMNDSWKPIMENFGTHFLDIAMNYVYDFLMKFFNNVPTKYYLTDDLTSLA